MSGPNLAETAQAVNFYAEPNVRLLFYQSLGTKPKQMLKKYVGVFEVVTDIDIKQLKRMIEDFEKRKEVVIRCPEVRYFSGLYQKKVNLKSQDVYYEFRDIRTVKGMRRGQFTVKLNAAVGIRHFLTGVLQGNSFGRILTFGVRKIGFHEKNKNEKETRIVM